MESFRTDTDKSTTRIVRKLGSHEELLKEHGDPEAWARGVVDEMNKLAKEGKQKIIVSFSPFEQIDKGQERLFDGNVINLRIIKKTLVKINNKY